MGMGVYHEGFTGPVSTPEPRKLLFSAHRRAGGLSLMVLDPLNHPLAIPSSMFYSRPARAILGGKIIALP